MNPAVSSKSAQVIDFGAYKSQVAAPSGEMATSMLLAAMTTCAGNLALQQPDQYLTLDETDLLEHMIGTTAALYNSMPGRVERDVLRTFGVYELDELTAARLPEVARFLEAWRS